MAALHIRYEGRSIDLTTEQLDVGAEAPDQDILAAVAHHFNEPVAKLNGMIVDRTVQGAITVRPQAVFGAC